PHADAREPSGHFAAIQRGPRAPRVVRIRRIEYVVSSARRSSCGVNATRSDRPPCRTTQLAGACHAVRAQEPVGLGRDYHEVASTQALPSTARGRGAYSHTRLTNRAKRAARGCRPNSKGSSLIAIGPPAGGLGWSLSTITSPHRYT